jgi:hypothetical protein
MKALTTAAGTFGPFKGIEVMSDRYHCDDTDLPFTVIGQGDIVDADTITWPAPVVPPKTREQLKAERDIAVAAITVTTQAGNTFDGDETSQGRMSRAIIALSTGLAPSVSWVLADNSVIQATAAELTEALVLAGQEQAAIWVIA